MPQWNPTADIDNRHLAVDISQWTPGISPPPTNTDSGHPTADTGRPTAPTVDKHPTQTCDSRSPAVDMRQKQFDIGQSELRK